MRLSETWIKSQWWMGKVFLHSTNTTIVIQIHIFKCRITSHDMRRTVTRTHRHTCTHVGAYKHTWWTDLPLGTFPKPVMTRLGRPRQTVIIQWSYAHPSPKLCSPSEMCSTDLLPLTIYAINVIISTSAQIWSFLQHASSINIWENQSITFHIHEWEI